MKKGDGRYSLADIGVNEAGRVEALKRIYGFRLLSTGGCSNGLSVWLWVSDSMYVWPFSLIKQAKNGNGSDLRIFFTEVLIPALLLSSSPRDGMQYRRGHWFHSPMRNVVGTSCS